jgi:hypothetical protein
LVPSVPTVYRFILNGDEVKLLAWVSRKVDEFVRALLSHKMRLVTLRPLG